MLRTLLAALPLRQAVGLATELTGASRNVLYARALVLKGGETEDDAAHLRARGSAIGTRRSVACF